MPTKQSRTAVVMMNPNRFMKVTSHSRLRALPHASSVSVAEGA